MGKHTFPVLRARSASLKRRRLHEGSPMARAEPTASPSVPLRPQIGPEQIPNLEVFEECPLMPRSVDQLQSCSSCDDVACNRSSRQSSVSRILDDDGKRNFFSGFIVRSKSDKPCVGW